MLDIYRKEIDRTDRELLSLFSQRLDIVRKIGAVKREMGLPIENTEREEQMLAERDYSSAEKAFLKSMMRISKELQKSCFNIYLIGMPFSGKTTLLSNISELTDRICADTDAMTEKHFGMSIPDIFRIHGETAFRDAEAAALRECAGHGSMVVSTGGGILTHAENIPIIRNSGIVVLCDRPLDELGVEYEKNPLSRPLIHSREELELMYFERFRPYRENADIIVDMRKSSCAAEIISFAKENGLRV